MTDPLLDLNPALNILPDSFRSIHIMGIGGTAMAALAGMLKQSGYQVSGSDTCLYPPMSDFLAHLGIHVFSGYQAENLHEHPDVVIVGNVITRANPEAQALAAAGIPYLSMPQALSRLYISSRRSLVVAGTHGKTTTGSLLACALHYADMDPSFMIGGIVREFNANYRLGRGDFFITEGDEYDTAFFDKESKFLHYRPEVAIITSIEFDHADIFADLQSIKKMFRTFVRLLPEHGLLVANFDDPHVVDIAQSATCPVQSYGLTPDCDWRLSRITASPGTTTYSLSFSNKTFPPLTIGLPGVHNCLNSAAVFAVMYHLGMAPTVIASGLRKFSGVRRRQEVRGTVGGITVIDDFAHHPTAVRETLSALKHAWTGRRLIAIFEPRTNTSRRSFFQQDYISAFAAADISIIKEAPLLKPQDSDDRFSAEQLASDLTTCGQTAFAFPDSEKILNYLRTALQPEDLVVILSNGGFDDIHERLLTLLRRLYPA